MARACSVLFRFPSLIQSKAQAEPRLPGQLSGTTFTLLNIVRVYITELDERLDYYDPNNYPAPNIRR